MIGATNGNSSVQQPGFSSHASGNLSYQITLLSNPPAAMIFKPKPPPAMMMSHSPKPASVQISTFLGECLHAGLPYIANATQNGHLDGEFGDRNPPTR